jgi:hygromycin-B 7''-O-kinase
MAGLALPASIDPAGLDALQAEPARWLPVVAALAGRFSTGPVQAAPTSTVLVGLAPDVVVKLYAPFLHDHFAYERAALAHLHGRLPVPTPQRLDDGTLDGWPWLAMTRLPGHTLDTRWATLSEATRLTLLQHLGEVAAALHALPLGPMPAVAPAWPAFLAGQRARCEARQRRTGLPPQLLEQLPAFLRGPVPKGPDVMLTGEFTPFNLLVDEGGTLRGMIDFGDGLVGPREYDWLGPMCFYAAGPAAGNVAGQPARLDAFFAGYGRPAPRAEREPLLRLLLLHRYSNLRAQLASAAGWADCADFATLARHCWPDRA